MTSKLRKGMELFLLFIVLAIAVLILTHLKVVGWVWDNLTAPILSFDESSEDHWEGGESIVNLQYADVSETDYLNLYLPYDTENPQLMVLVHGGGFVTNDNMSRQARLMINYFRDHGYAVASVNYRLAQEALYPAAIMDVKAAVRFLRAHADEYGYDASGIAIWGESAGGYLATMAAVTDDTEFNDLKFIGQDSLGDVSARVSTLIDYYGVVDMAHVEADWEEVGLPYIVYRIANNWAMGYMKEVGATTIEGAWIGKEFSEMTQEEIDACTPLYYLQLHADLNRDLNVWICHGNSDITVPVPQSVRLYTLAQEVGCRQTVIDLIDNARHADDRCYYDEELAKVDAFLQNHVEGSD